MSSADYLKITFSDGEVRVTSEQNRFQPFAISSVYKSRIVDAKQLTSGPDVKRTYSIRIDIQDIKHEFRPGDTIGILPENDEKEVELILERLHLKPLACKFYHLEVLKETSKKNAAIPQHIPKQSTLLEVFLKHVDIRTPPKKLFLKMLLRFTDEQKEVDKLQHLTSPSGSAEYIKFLKDHSTLLSLLTAFPSCQPPVERILENLGPLQPRPYSISSSPLTEQLWITFSVIELGVCSRWLEKMINSITSTSVCEAFDKLSLNLSNHLSFYFRKRNQFQIPSDPSRPIIMIGPGTGVAPFIGFLQHRELEKNRCNTEFGSSWLFYGCRYFDRDFLYKLEIDRYLENGILSKLYSCSSRDGPNKIYVQDLIKQNCESFVIHLIENEAIIYVCGDAKNMAKDVKATITNCIKDRMAWSETQTNAFIKNLEDNCRYIEDVWL